MLKLTPGAQCVGSRLRVSHVSLVKRETQLQPRGPEMEIDVDVATGKDYGSGALAALRAL